MQWCTLSMLPVLPQRVASKRITLKLDFLILNLGWWVSENQVSYEHGIGMGGVQKPCLKGLKCDVASQRVIGIPWDPKNSSGMQSVRANGQGGSTLRQQTHKASKMTSSQLASRTVFSL